MQSILEYIKKTKTTPYYESVEIKSNMRLGDMLSSLIAKFGLDTYEYLGLVTSSSTTKFIEKTDRTNIGLADIKLGHIIYVSVNDGSLYRFKFDINDKLTEASFIKNNSVGSGIDNVIKMINSL